ncbi:phage tail fiber protein [Streptomyces sp. BH105]|uniref:phage tail fiber protein n=1 Tax=Streptomyces sp. BH105 TaxID=3410408 RepID=UPI003CF838CE
MSLLAGNSDDSVADQLLAEPRTRYLALVTADPGDMATKLSELQAVGYQRQAVTLATPDTGGGVVQSGTPAQISLTHGAVFGPFTEMTGSGDAVTHMALVTAATGTDFNVLAVWPLDVPVTAAQGDSMLAQAGSLTIRVA